MNNNLSLEEIVNSNIPVALWGCGVLFNSSIHLFIKHINIVAITDICKDNIPQEYKSLFLPKEELSKKVSTVILMTDNNKYIRENTDFLSNYSINVFTYNDIASKYLYDWEEYYLTENNITFTDRPISESDIFQCYIGLYVPVFACNLKCHYCYLEKDINYGFIPKLYHSPKYIRYKFSLKNVGNPALIGICGAGETLLTDNIIDICLELLKEGHYLHIVTNGLVIDKIKELIDKAGIYANRLMFKLSFHYLELKRLNKFNVFCDTVELIKNSFASFSIELMPSDEAVPFIEEIKEFSFKHFKALPHLTIGRAEYSERELLTNMTNEEYFDTWDQFDSIMFTYRRDLYMINPQNCYAGILSFYVLLHDGTLKRCLFNECKGNIYSKEFNGFHLDRVGNSCPFNYCYNCHLYGTIGVIQEASIDKSVKYLHIRDRVCSNGSHWIKEPVRKFIGQDLYTNYLKYDIKEE